MTKDVETSKDIVRCHLNNGVDINPYSTEVARWSFQRGYEGKPHTLVTYLIPYNRGVAVAALMKEKQNEPQVPR